MQYRNLLRAHLRDYRKLDYVKPVNWVSAGRSTPIVDCSFGVNPFGHSSKIDVRTLLDGIDISNYPPFPYDDLKDALIGYWAKHASLERKNIRVCAGSMLIVDVINSIFIDAEDAVLGYSPQFPEYVNSLRLRGGRYDACRLRPESGYHFLARDLLKRLEQGLYKLVYLDNPNNPTGQVLSLDDIEAIVDRASQRGICVIVDEAYGDYMDPENSAINLLGSYDNLFVVRSFSKGYALAAMRIGYVVASEDLCACYGLADDLLVNPAGLGAAITSLSDADYLPRILAMVAQVKAEILGAVQKLRVLATNERVPIFTLQHPDPTIDFYQLLYSHGVVTTSGFEGLGRNSVRLRIPRESAGLIKVLSAIQEDL